VIVTGFYHCLHIWLHSTPGVCHSGFTQPQPGWVPGVLLVCLQHFRPRARLWTLQQLLRWRKGVQVSLCVCLCWHMCAWLVEFVKHIVLWREQKSTQCFGNWISFCAPVKGGEAPTLSGPLERTYSVPAVQRLRTEIGPFFKTLCDSFCAVGNTGQWFKSRSQVVLNVTCHYWNPLEVI
jgi:hypothetical protein